MVNYKLIILAIAFLAALFASLSIHRLGAAKKAFRYEPREGLRSPESGHRGHRNGDIHHLCLRLRDPGSGSDGRSGGSVYVARKEVA